jgi:hypothetical protein
MNEEPSWLHAVVPTAVVASNSTETLELLLVRQVSRRF